MNKLNIEEEVITVVADITDIPKDTISSESSFMDDLELSSLEILTLIAAIENKFGINFKEAEIRRIANIQDMVYSIKDKI